jgi:hypothetical protein
VEGVKQVWARAFVILMTLLRPLTFSWLSEVDDWAQVHSGPALTKVHEFQHDEPLDDDAPDESSLIEPPPPFEPMQHDAWPHWDDVDHDDIGWIVAA